MAGIMRVQGLGFRVTLMLGHCFGRKASHFSLPTALLHNTMQAMSNNDLRCTADEPIHASCRNCHKLLFAGPAES